MSDSILKRYNQVLKNLDLDGCPISEYDELDMFCLIINLEKTFKIQIDDDEADKLFKLDSHEARIEYIKTLL